MQDNFNVGYVQREAATRQVSVVSTLDHAAMD